MKREGMIYPGQRGWVCPKCRKYLRALTDDRMLQKVYDHVCSKNKWWQFWDDRDHAPSMSEDWSKPSPVDNRTRYYW